MHPGKNAGDKPLAQQVRMEAPVSGNRSRTTWAALTLLVASAVLAGCGAGGGDAESSGSEMTELRIGVALGDLSTLDPASEIADASQVVLPMFGDRLLTVEPEDPTTVLPQLAESWEVNADASEYVFSLREDVTFVTGNPMTSADVVFSFERVRLKAGPSAFLLDTVSSITAVDDYTVKVTLTGPDSAFLAKLAACYLIVLDSQVLAENGGLADATAVDSDTAQEFLDGETIGSGPYILEEWRRNEQLTFTANPEYWGEAPKFETVTLLDIRDASTQRQLLERGDLDVALDIDPDTAAALEGTGGIEITSTPALNLIYLALNNAAPGTPELADVRVRQAIQLAVDYDGISTGLAGDAPRPPAVDPIGLQGVDQVELIETDVDAAIALLEDAGVDGLTLDVTFANQVLYGVPLTTLWEKLKSDLDAVGITVNLNPVEYDAWIEAFRAGELGMTTSLWGPDFIDSGHYLELFGRNEGLVAGRVNLDLPEGQGLYEAYLAETDEAARADIAAQSIEAMRDDASMIALAQPNKILAFSDALTGVAYSPNTQIDINAIAPA